MKPLYLQRGAFLEERETSRGLAEFWGKSCTRQVISSRQFLNCLNGARDEKLSRKPLKSRAQQTHKIKIRVGPAGGGAGVSQRETEPDEGLKSACSVTVLLAQPRWVNPLWRNTTSSAASEMCFYKFIIPSIQPKMTKNLKIKYDVILKEKEIKESPEKQDLRGLYWSLVKKCF